MSFYITLSNAREGHLSGTDARELNNCVTIAVTLLCTQIHTEQVHATPLYRKLQPVKTGDVSFHVACVAVELTHLSLRQVLVCSQEEGGEEGLQRPQVGEEAVNTEQEGRPQHRHVDRRLQRPRTRVEGTDILSG